MTNLDKLTREYFYPELLNRRPLSCSIPTTSELLLLGSNNLAEITEFLHRIITKLQLAIEQIKAERARIGQMNQSSEERFCSWHGAGYGKMLTVEKDDVMTKDFQAYRKQRQQRQSEVFTCELGRAVARWCNQTLRNQANLEYRRCLEALPFCAETCLLCHNTLTATAALNHLQTLIVENETKLDFARRYLKAISTVQASEPRPSFELMTEKYWQAQQPGARIVAIRRTRQGTFARRRGLFLGIELDEFGQTVAHFRMTGRKVIEICFPNRKQDSIIFLTETDDKYLRDNGGFREIWLKMVQTEFSTDRLREAFEPRVKQTSND